MTIEYKNANEEVIGRMMEVAGTCDQAVVIAQKYMLQVRGIETAHVLDGETETVVQRLSRWQAR